ncbi:hypothetical protein DFP73DRAFT_529839 [Morchella snyderi]|nr:hypothetical protein DFP73DRAFT_529839 [Morchella snyderi]
MVHSEINPDPRSRLIGDTCELKRKVHIELETPEAPHFELSSGSDEPLAKRYTKSSTAAAAGRGRRGDDKSGTIPGSTSSADKVPARRAPRKDAGDMAPHQWPVMMQGRFDTSSQRYMVFKNINTPATTSSAHSAQPGKAGHLQGAKKDSMTIDPDFHSPIRRTAHAATDDAPSPPTGLTAAAIERHRTVDAATQTSPSPERGSTGPPSAVIAERCIEKANTMTKTSPPSPTPVVAVVAAHSMTDTATSTADLSVIYIDGYPFNVPVEPVECFCAIQQRVIEPYRAIVRGRYMARDQAMASSVCNVSGVAEVMDEVEEGGSVKRWQGEARDDVGKESGGEEDYTTPKD